MYIRGPQTCDETSAWFKKHVSSKSYDASKGAVTIVQSVLQMNMTSKCEAGASLLEPMPS